MSGKYYEYLTKSSADAMINTGWGFADADFNTGGEFDLHVRLRGFENTSTTSTNRYILGIGANSNNYIDVYCKKISDGNRIYLGRMADGYLHTEYIVQPADDFTIEICAGRVNTTIMRIGNESVTINTSTPLGFAASKPLYLFADYQGTNVAGSYVSANICSAKIYGKKDATSSPRMLYCGLPYEINWNNQKIITFMDAISNTAATMSGTWSVPQN